MSTKTFINNLYFLGLRIAPKTNPKHSKDFNKRQFAKFLEVADINIIRWLKGSPVSQTNLNRIANKITVYLNRNIDSDMLLSQNLKEISDKSTQYSHNNTVNSTIIRDSVEILFIDQILYYLKKYPELQRSIYNFLTLYHNAHK